MPKIESQLAMATHGCQPPVRPPGSMTTRQSARPPLMNFAAVRAQTKKPAPAYRMRACHFASGKLCGHHLLIDLSQRRHHALYIDVAASEFLRRLPHQALRCRGVRDIALHKNAGGAGGLNQGQSGLRLGLCLSDNESRFS